MKTAPSYPSPWPFLLKCAIGALAWGICAWIVYS